MCLRGLGADDRKWLLARLSESQRQLVLAAEKQLLEIVQGRCLDFRHFLELEPLQPTVANALDETVSLLDSKPFATVKDGLDQLPAVWVGGILSSAQWSGSERYLATQSAPRQTAIREGAYVLKVAVKIAMINEFGALLHGEVQGG